MTAFEIEIKEDNVLMAKAVTCRQKVAVQFDDGKKGKTKQNALKKPRYRLDSGTLKRVFDKNNDSKMTIFLLEKVAQR